MHRLRLLVLLTLPLFLISCARREPGTNARVTLAIDYPYGQGLRVLLLPVRVEGHPHQQEDQAAMEQYGQRLMEIGYRVIDWEQARSRSAASGVNLSAANEADVMRVARDLGVDAIAKGRVSMIYSPGRSENGVRVEKVTRTEIRNGTRRQDTVKISEDVPTSYSYSVEGSYSIASQGLSLVSVRNGEVMLSASVDQGNYNMTDELAWGIRRAVVAR